MAGWPPPPSVWPSRRQRSATEVCSTSITRRLGGWQQSSHAIRSIPNRQPRKAPCHSPEGSGAPVQRARLTPGSSWGGPDPSAAREPVRSAAASRPSSGFRPASSRRSQTARRASRSAGIPLIATPRTLASARYAVRASPECAVRRYVRARRRRAPARRAGSLLNAPSFRRWGARGRPDPGIPAVLPRQTARRQLPARPAEPGTHSARLAESSHAHPRRRSGHAQRPLRRLVAGEPMFRLGQGSIQRSYHRPPPRSASARLLRGQRPILIQKFPAQPDQSRPGGRSTARTPVRAGSNSRYSATRSSSH